MSKAVETAVAVSRTPNIPIVRSGSHRGFERILACSMHRLCYPPGPLLPCGGPEAGNLQGLQQTEINPKHS
eukprot:1187493-Prorocentrum_minimum.AAC.3